MPNFERFAELALLRRLTPDHAVLSDRLLPAMSSAADRSLIWVVVAAALATVGGDRGRRAASEGLIAVGVASALVNGPLKTAVRRPRPGQGVLGRFVVERGHAPKTSSMPSGHSTSAAAFAFAAGASMPVIAAPLAAVAGLVAWSRLNAGRHYTSDVVVGLALGAAVGASVHAAAQKLVPEQRRVN